MSPATHELKTIRHCTLHTQHMNLPLFAKAKKNGKQAEEIPLSWGFQAFRCHAKALSSENLIKPSSKQHI